ncbi:MAG TPA: MFS transporter [Acidimicrobiales bacterium]|nr:MFS transporter [Acidimicrobiales bacterium]
MHSADITTGRPEGSGRPARMGLILVASFMVVLDFSIVNVALASIERELHAGAADVQWVITAYAITFGGMLIVGGRLGDVLGRRRMFIAGLGVFSLASLAGGAATSIQMLIVARAVQGMGAAVVAPAALSLITTGSPKGEARNRALGIYGATAAVGFVAGLVLGGVLVQYFDWRSVLWVNVPVGLAAAGLAPLLIARDRTPDTRPHLDMAGAMLITGSIAAFVYGLSQGPATGWLAASTLVALAVSFTLGTTFIIAEQRHPAPLLPFGVLRHPALRAGNLLQLLAGGWVAGELLTMPLYLQLDLHYTPLMTGLAMAPQGVIGFLGARRGADLLRRVGLKTFLVASAVSAGLGLSLLAMSLGSHQYILLAAGFMLAGYGTATAGFGSTVAATQALPDDQQGIAGGLINMSRQVGAAIGVAVVAAVIAADSTGSTASTQRDAVSLAVLAIAAFVAAIAVSRTMQPTKATMADQPTGRPSIPTCRRPKSSPRHPLDPALHPSRRSPDRPTLVPGEKASR